MSTEGVARNPAIYSYQMVLYEEPTYWNLYPKLAALLSTPAEQSHILLKGAWHALEEREYKIAKELSDEAQKKYGNSFCARVIEVELLRAQGQGRQIPGKLQEIGRIFEETKLPGPGVKAYKRLALLEPSAG